MGKVFNGITVIAVVIIIFWLFNIDYNDLSWKNNMSPYLSIIALVIISISLQIQRITIVKKKKNKDNQ